MSKKPAKKGGGIKLAAAAGVAAAFLGGTKPGHSVTATLTGVFTGGTAGCRKLERLWMAAGGSPAQAETAASVAMAESGGDQYSTEHNTNGTTDRGYWQINSVHGAQSTYNPKRNARAAVAISGDGSNWTAWVTYDNGSYAGRC